MNITRLSAILAAIFVLVSWWIIVTPASDVLPEATNRAQTIDFIIKFMLVGSVAIFLIVEGFLLYFVLKYRERATDAPDAIGPDIHGNTRLEIIWSVIPAIFLVVLTAMSFKVYTDIIAPQPNEYVIHVIAKQFSWECDHPKYGIQEFTACHMPVDTNVRIELTALDVIHSFWAPEFRVKQDAVPGYPTRMHFTPNRVGQYRLICSELCGPGHSSMYTKMYVCPIDPRLAAKSTTCDGMTFDAWARNFKKQSSGPVSLANLSFSKDIKPLFQAHCIGCHIGAALGGLNLDSYSGLQKGGSVVPGVSIIKPGDHKASILWKMVQPTGPWPGGNRMPLGGPYLSDAQIKTIAAWIDQGAKNN
jgi:cytochrome c oxidase subunit II